MKKFLCVFALFIFAFMPVFAKDNIHISVREDGEIISGFKVADSSVEVKINILYPANYKDSDRVPLTFILDTQEYKIENLKQMFYGDINNNPQSLIASVRFKNAALTQEQFDKFLEEVFAFFELNYKAENEPLKKIILAKNNFALLALNSLNKESNYFYNLGIILDNTTALPIIDKVYKKPVRIFAFSQKANIINMQNIFISAGLEPMQNFFFKINDKPSFEQFDLRYFLNLLPKIKQIKPILSKEIVQETPFYLQVKTAYDVLDFLPMQIKFAPPVLAYDEDSAYLKVLLPEVKKVKISGVFAGKKWAQKVKISK
jgi:hypothetical protein